LDQVVVALVGRRQQHQVVRRLARISASGVPTARRHVDLAAEDRVDSALPRVVVKNDRRKQIPVLGHGDGRHVQLRGLIKELVYAARAVQQRVLGVQVKMDEISHHRTLACGIAGWQDSRSAGSKGKKVNTLDPFCHPAILQSFHSHSIVDGGFELMSYTTRLIPLASFTIREEMRASSSCGRRAQSAVIPSRLSTARMATVYSYVRASPMTPTL